MGEKNMHAKPLEMREEEKEFPFSLPETIDILVGTDTKKHRELKRALEVFHSREFSDVEFERLIGTQRHRQIVHEYMKRELENRLRHNPDPTAEELHMGAFEQQIEPQVRYAVLELRKRGYNTASSGYHALSEQAICLSEGQFNTLPLRVREELNTLGINISNDGRVLFWQPPTPDVHAIKNFWDMILRHIPNLHTPAKMNMTPIAVDFRKKYEKKAA